VSVTEIDVPPVTAIVPPLVTPFVSVIETAPVEAVFAPTVIAPDCESTIVVPVPPSVATVVLPVPVTVTAIVPVGFVVDEPPTVIAVVAVP
jgi:hypothetical protein